MNLFRQSLRPIALTSSAVGTVLFGLLMFAAIAFAGDAGSVPAGGILLTPKSQAGSVGGCWGSGSATQGPGESHCWSVDVYLVPGNSTLVPVVQLDNGRTAPGDAPPSESFTLGSWSVGFDNGTKTASGGQAITIPPGAKMVKTVHLTALFNGTGTQQTADEVYDYQIPPLTGVGQPAVAGPGSTLGANHGPSLPIAGLTLATLGAAAAGLMAAATGAAVSGGAKPGPKIIIAPKAGDDQLGPDLTFPEDADGAAAASIGTATSAAKQTAAASNGEGQTVDVSDLGEGPPDAPIDANDLLDKLIHSKSGEPDTVDIADLGEKPPDFVSATSALDDMPTPERKVKVAALGDRPDSTEGTTDEAGRGEQGDEYETEDDSQTGADKTPPRDDANSGDGGLGGALSGHSDTSKAADTQVSSTDTASTDKGIQGAAQPTDGTSKPILARDQSGLSEPPPESQPAKLDDGLEPPKLDKVAEAALKASEPPAGFDRYWDTGWAGQHAYNPDTGEVAHYADGHWTVSKLPDGFSPGDNPNFAQNPSTGAVAHYDPTTNEWGVPKPPPGFEPIPGPQGGDMPYGSMTYINPTTGQTIHFGGEGWVDSRSGGPITHSFNSTTGQTAYLDPNTQQWAVHDPPPGYRVDSSVPDDQLGYHFVNDSGDRATFDPYQQKWVDTKTGQILAPTAIQPPAPRAVEAAQAAQPPISSNSTAGDVGSEPQTVERPNTYVQVDPKISDEEAAQAGKDEAYPEGNVTRDIERRGMAARTLREESLPAEHSDYQPPVSVVHSDTDIPVDKPQPGADEPMPQTVERPNSSVKVHLDEKEAADATALHQDESTPSNEDTLEVRREVTQEQLVDKDAPYVGPVTMTTAPVDDHSDHIPIPEGPPNRDHQEVLDVIADTQARLDDARAAGAPQSEIDQLEAHLEEYKGYEAAYHTLGGAHAVNQVAQQNDLSGQIGIVNKTVEVGMQAAAMQGAQSIEGSFGHLEDAPTGLHGSESASAHGEGGSGSSSGEAGADTVKGAGDETVPPAHADTVKGAGAETQTLPPDGASQSRALRADEKTTFDKTEAGAPDQGQLDAARQAAADRVAQQHGYRDVADMQLHEQVSAQQQQLREQSLREIKDGLEGRNPVTGKTGYVDTIYGHTPGELPEVTADRYALQHSLESTPFSPSQAEVNLNANKYQLEDLVTGNSKTLEPTEANVSEIYRRYSDSYNKVQQGTQTFPDYWERMDPSTRDILQHHLADGQHKDLDYWLTRLRQLKQTD